MNKINKFIAKKVTLIFGTMYMCYAFIIYGLLPLIPLLQPYQNMLMYWSTWIQLWALPLIIVGQNVLGEASEKRSVETHTNVLIEMNLIKEELSLAKEQRKLADTQRLEINKKMDEIIKLVQYQKISVNWMEEMRKTNIELWKRIESKSK